MADEFDLLGQPMTGPAEPRGRRKHKPSEQQRNLVLALAGYGVPQEQIARLVQVDPTTLRQRYRDELDQGAPHANAKVAQNLFKIATGPGREAVTAAMFWLRARAGWSEFSAPPESAQKQVPLGKKDAAAVAAESADANTGWAGLVH